jgi:hypothetical protein
LTLDQKLEERRKEGVDVEGLAEGIGKAESIRDLTESLAETLFGDEEFEAIAAQVIANPPPGKTAPGKAAPNKAAPSDKGAAPKNPVALNQTAAAGDISVKDPSLVLELMDDVDPEDAAKSSESTGDDNMTSTTRRLDLVKRLNTSGAGGDLEKIEVGEDKPKKKAAKPDKSEPASIEEQMTSTLKTLGSADGPPTPSDEDEPKEKKPTSIFSRFGRSS